MKPYISVIICTIGHYDQLRSCLTSIINNHYSNYEIIVVSFNKLPSSISLLATVVYTNKRGLGQARNLGIRASQGDILVFTDDDCIVSQDWLCRIDKNTKRVKRADAFFGRVLPCKPHSHRGKICPSVVTNKIVRTYLKPVNPSIVGSGNNMILRKQTIKENGYFKQWLGPGSIGKNADDTEIILRLLSEHRQIRFDPSIVVYHDRWLSSKTYREQYLDYMYGDAVNYMYHSLKKVGKARSLLSSLYKNNLKQLDRFRNKRDVARIIAGSFVGLFFFIKEKLFHSYA